MDKAKDFSTFPSIKKTPIRQTHGIRNFIEMPSHVKGRIGRKRSKEVMTGRFKLDWPVSELDQWKFLGMNDEGDPTIPNKGLRQAR